MATIHKLTKDGATIFPATITDAVVHQDTGKTLTSMIKEYNVSELFPTEGIAGGNTYNLALAVQVLGTHLRASEKTGGIKLTFISSVFGGPMEEYYLGKNSWSAVASDWKQRIEVGDAIIDPAGEWDPSSAETYIDSQVATVTSDLAAEVVARQTGDSNLQSQITDIKKHKVYLTGTTLTQSMINTTNTIYVVKDNLILDSNITVPANCVLEFDGGSLSNGTVNGNNTCIQANLVKIFSNIHFDGLFSIQYFFPEWFGAIGDGENDDTVAVNAALKAISETPKGGILKLNKLYIVTDTIKVYPNTSIIGDGASAYSNYSGLFQRSGFKYVGNETNLWIVDFVNSEVQLEYNELGINSMPSVHRNRNCMMEFGGFNILTSTKNVFGALRIVWAFDMEVHDLYIIQTRYGLAVSASVGMLYRNITVGSSTLGFFFGGDTTTNTVISCKAMRTNYINNDDVIGFSDAVFGDNNNKTNHIPPYLTDIKNAAIIVDDRMDTRVSLWLYGFGFQDYDACILANNGYIYINGSYYERYKTIFWIFGGKLKADTPQTITQNNDYYQFGTQVGQIEVKDFSYSRCYTPTDTTTSRNKTQYLVQVANQEKICFYDDYDVAVGETSNRVYNKAKHINLEKPSLCMTNREETGMSIIDIKTFTTPYTSLGTGMYYGSVSQNEMQKRLEILDNNDITIYIKTYIDGSNLLIKNKTIRFRRGTDASYIAIERDKPLCLAEDCTIYIDDTINQASSATPLIMVKGGIVNIIVNKTAWWNPKIVGIANTRHTEVHVKNIGTQAFQVTGEITIVENSVAPYKVVTEDYNGTIRTFTNISGNVLPGSALLVGQQFFNTTDNIVYTWNGSVWVDPTGATNN